MAILKIDNLTKNYKSVKALNNVSFSVPAKTVFGILGPNGSGKTTLLGIVMDVIKASGGTYTWEESNEPAHDLRKKIGTLLETPNFYHYLSAEKNLMIAAKIKGRGEGDIEKVLKSGAKVIFSGILKTRKDDILNKVEKYNLKKIDELVENDWISYVFEYK